MRLYWVKSDVFWSDDEYREHAIALHVSVYETNRDAMLFCNSEETTSFPKPLLEPFIGNFA